MYMFLCVVYYFSAPHWALLLDVCERSRCTHLPSLFPYLSLAILYPLVPGEENHSVWLCNLLTCFVNIETLDLLKAPFIGPNSCWTVNFCGHMTGKQEIIPSHNQVHAPQVQMLHLSNYIKLQIKKSYV